MLIMSFARLPNVELVKRLETACQMFPLTNVIFLRFTNDTIHITYMMGPH